MSSPQNRSHIEGTKNQELREMLISFYDVHLYRGDSSDDSQLFTSEDKAEALAYFDGEGSSISTEELTLRRIRSLFLREKTKAFAINQKREFLSRLHRLDIALDTKKILESRFFRSSFAGKAELMKYVMLEDERISTKKLLQMHERESYKASYWSFFEAHREYFSYEDQIVAWNYVLASLSAFRTHIGKMRRLQAVLAMLPGNLAYARSLDEEYQRLLAIHIEDSGRRSECLAAFRLCTFKNKADRIAELKKRPTIAQKRKQLEQEKYERLEIYKNLYALFPHGTHPDVFSEQSSAEQKRIINQKKASNAEEEGLLREYLNLGEPTMEQSAAFKRMSLSQKKEHLQNKKLELTQQSATAHEKTQTSEAQIAIVPIRPLKICLIAAKVLRNQENHTYVDDGDRVKAVKKQMAAEGATGDFTLQHLQIIQSLLSQFSTEEYENPGTLQWVELELKKQVYVGESARGTSSTETRLNLRSTVDKAA